MDKQIIWVFQGQIGKVEDVYRWRTHALFSDEETAKEVSAALILKEWKAVADWRRVYRTHAAGDGWEASYRVFDEIGQDYYTHRARLVPMELDKFVGE